MSQIGSFKQVNSYDRYNTYWGTVIQWKVRREVKYITMEMTLCP